MRDRAGADRAKLTVLLLFGCCGFALASLRLHTGFFLLFAPVYLGITLWGRAGLVKNPHLLVPVEALALGLVLCWVGLFVTTEPYGKAGYGPVSWPDYHPATKAGFPIQGVLGDGGGGAPDFVPLGKGLLCLLGNLLACTVAAWFVLFALSARAVKRILIPLASAAAFASFAASFYFIYYFD